MLRTLHENNVQTFCPIALIDWTNEEGARFPGAMMSSGVWSTKSSTSLEACHEIKDTEGTTMLKALSNAGYLGDTRCDYRENGLESYFELHIEQGPKLEAANNRVGVVTAVQGMKWYAIRVSGEVSKSSVLLSPFTCLFWSVFMCLESSENFVCSFGYTLTIDWAITDRQNL